MFTSQMEAASADIQQVNFIHPQRKNYSLNQNHHISRAAGSGSTGMNSGPKSGPSVVTGQQEKRKKSDDLFMQSEDAFKELMQSNVPVRGSKKSLIQKKQIEESKSGGTGEDEFGLSNVKYEPMFK